MTAQQLLDKLIGLSPSRKADTWDKVLYGNGEAQVSKAAVCFKATVNVIRQAAARGADVIIAHEPLFFRDDFASDMPFDGIRKITDEKKALLDATGISVIRYHDHAHTHVPDFIHQGFLNALNLEDAVKRDDEGLGMCGYELSHPIALKDLAREISVKVTGKPVKVVGAKDMTVSTMCLGLGWVGKDQIKVLLEKPLDVYITGEIAEVCDLELIRDAVSLGYQKAVLVLGHYSSEYKGMELAAGVINEWFPAFFIPGGEVFTFYDMGAEKGADE